MKTTELTDIDGDALTITQRLDGTWITCTKGAEEVTIGPIPTDAIRHAFEQPMGGDDMDGGVTAAAIENEVVSPDRARSLVQERDELAEALDTTMGRAIKAERERDELRAAVVELAPAPTASPRPEGAEDVESQIEAWDQEYGDDAIMTAPRLRELADYLAERGVRVTGAES